MNTIAHILGYAIDLLAALLGSVLILRAWLYSQAIPSSDPICRFCNSMTDWLVLPISRSMHNRLGKWHLPALLAACGIAILSCIFSRILFSVPLSLLGLIVAPFALLARWATELVLWGTVIWAVLSWFGNPSPTTRTLGYLLDPFLRPLRKIVPQIRNFDLSPVVLFVLCQLLLIVVTPLARGIV